MAILEVVLFASVMGAMILTCVPRRPLRIWAFGCAAAGVIAAIALAVTYLRWRSSAAAARRTWRHTLVASMSALSGLVLLTAALLPLLVFPNFRPPQPAGPHGVGMVDLHLIDTARAETMTA